MDVNDLTTSTTGANNQIKSGTFINDLNMCIGKVNFKPVNFNCVLNNVSSSGILEIVACKDININEEIVCWFSDTYLKNIKSIVY